MNEVVISGRQSLLLIVGSVTVMGHLYMVPIVIGLAGRDGWMSILVALIPALGMSLVLAGLAWLAPGRSLAQILVDVLGKIPGKIMGLAYTLFFILAPAITIRGLMDFMKVSFMPMTPPAVFGLTFLFISGFAVFGGLERLIRVNEILLPVLIAAGILAWSLTFPLKDYQMLLPLLESGISPVLSGSIPLMGLVAEMVALGMIQPSVRQQKQLWRYYSAGMLLITLMFIGPLTGPVAMFGATMASSLYYPTFNEIENIILGDFIQGLQVLAIILWLFGSFGRISFFYYASIRSAAQMFGLRQSRWLVFPVGAVIMLLALFVFRDNLMVRDLLGGVYPRISIALGMVLPAVLLAVLAGRRRFS